MKKIFVLLVTVFAVLLSICAMASADSNCYGCCTNCSPYYPVTPTYSRNCATFVSDVTIADGSYVQPGSSFTKTWRLRNNGTTTWTTNYKLVFVSGSQMTAPNFVYLPYNVAPGQTVDISVPMISPLYSGSYKGNWMLETDTGVRFGVGNTCQTAIWVQIINYVPSYTPNYGYQPGPQPQWWNRGQEPWQNNAPKPQGNPGHQGPHGPQGPQGPQWPQGPNHPGGHGGNHNSHPKH